MTNAAQLTMSTGGAAAARKCQSLDPTNTLRVLPRGLVDAPFSIAFDAYMLVTNARVMVQGRPYLFHDTGAGTSCDAAVHGR